LFKTRSGVRVFVGITWHSLYSPGISTLFVGSLKKYQLVDA